MNIGGVSGLIPLTGVPLLLISHGGSAMISIMACLGMCQGVIDKYQKSRDDRRKLIA
jgi:cell division protein FtsW